jgi:molybdopterin converting factor small subunit
MTDTEVNAQEAREEFTVPPETDEDGWYEVPIWVMHAAYVIGGGKFMLKETEQIFGPGETLVKDGDTITLIPPKAATP